MSLIVFINKKITDETNQKAFNEEKQQIWCCMCLEKQVG